MKNGNADQHNDNNNSICKPQDWHKWIHLQFISPGKLVSCILSTYPVLERQQEKLT